MRLPGKLCLGSTLWGGGVGGGGVEGFQESLAVGSGAQELDLGISRGLGGSRAGEMVPRVPTVGLWKLVSFAQSVLCSKDVRLCRKPVGGREGHNHVGFSWPHSGPLKNGPSEKNEARGGSSIGKSWLLFPGGGSRMGLLGRSVMGREEVASCSLFH